MKVCDYIVKYMEAKGVRHVFGYPGGMILPLMNSLSYSEKIKLHVTYHEQGAALAACGYAKTRGEVGVVLSTSGPGATNLITGIADAYFDSAPVIFITGQCNSKESKGDRKVRQKGFQETDIVSIVKRICKYAVYVDEPENIRKYLALAFFYASEGRGGSVLLDIPMDVLQSEIDGDVSEEISIIQKAKSAKAESDLNYELYTNIKNSVLYELAISKKPLIIVGNGIYSSKVRNECIKLLNTLEIPVVSTMMAVDISPDISKYYGFIGVYGHRLANIILNECDLLICLGTRLSIRQTGFQISKFAPMAKIIRIDIDKAELDCRIRSDEIQFTADLRQLIPDLCNDSELEEEKNKIFGHKFAQWIERCRFLEKQLQGIDKNPENEIVKKISSHIPEGVAIVTDVGQNQIWAAQSFKFKQNQRMIFSGGHGAMGFALPAAIGAYYSSGKPVICFTGDGGFQMNIQELQFISHKKLPIKIFVFNNHGLGMIRHFQELNFDKNYAYTIEGHGYSNPDFCELAKAYKIDAYKISNLDSFENLSYELKNEKPVLFEFLINKDTYIIPRLSYKKCLNEQEPFLDEYILRQINRK